MGTWKKINYEARCKIEELLKSGSTVTELMEHFNISRTAMTEELMKGMDIIDYKFRRYALYSAKLAQQAQMKIVAQRAEKEINRLQGEIEAYEANGK